MAIRKILRRFLAFTGFKSWEEFIIITLAGCGALCLLCSFFTKVLSVFGCL